MQINGNRTLKEKSFRYIFCLNRKGIKKKRDFKAGMIFTFILMFSFLTGALSVYSQLPEYELKSVLILKVIDYINWPEDHDNKKDEFVITVLGENPFGEYLDLTFEEKKIYGKKVNIKYINDHKDISGSDVLFITRSERSNIKKILSVIKGKPILTIGDTIGFGEKGVHINFLVENNRVRFYLNESSAQQSGLEIDFHLRNVSKKIY